MADIFSDTSELEVNLNDLTNKLTVACIAVANTEAKRLESHMKQNRPWTDRTGLAKQRLNTSVSTINKNAIRITLAHGVEYGIWLELANNENYAIIKPTMMLEGPKTFESFKGLFEKIFN